MFKGTMISLRLHNAVLHDRTDAVKFLLGMGVDRGITNDDGGTHWSSQESWATPISSSCWSATEASGSESVNDSIPSRLNSFYIARSGLH